MRNTRQVHVGFVPIGGGAPITVQSMTNTKTSDVKSTIAQIKKLEAAGCDIVRCAVPDQESARAISKIKEGINVPLVADIHFDHKLAIAAIKNGADKIRINPGNIGSEAAVKEVVLAAKDVGIPIRIGVNGGSLQKDILARFEGVTPKALVESALRNIEMIDSFGFNDIVLSVKTSDVRANLEVHKLLSEKTDCPLHIGITEAGSGMMGVTKSAIGIGSLLLSGIGDTIRVSLTGNPVREVECGMDILSSLGLRKGSFDIISCPTCGRTEMDIETIAANVEAALKELKFGRLDSQLESISVAIMGCAVNGPGEAKSADYGVACGGGKGAIFKKGEVLKTVSEEKIVDELIFVIKEDI